MEKAPQVSDRGTEFSKWRGQKLWDGVGRGMLLMLKSLGGRDCSWGYRDRKADEIRSEMELWGVLGDTSCFKRFSSTLGCDIIGERLNEG